ncbi:MAG: hypothetical protein WKG32_08870 [Gemmatimonadaceae bacterium]
MATKRALVRVLDGGTFNQGYGDMVLLRVPGEEQAQRDPERMEEARRPGRYYAYFGHARPDHVGFVIRRHLAYVDRETEEWDAIEELALVGGHGDQDGNAG